MMRWLGVLVMSLLTLPVVTAAPASAAEIVLTTDASGAMFADGQLSPSYRSTRCLRIEWSENESFRLVGIAANVTGGLAPYLDLQVEVGSGGGYASCSGFRGDVLYQGTLAAFGGAHPHAAAQLPARRVSEGSGSVTFRLTMSVRDVNDAQSRTASAGFIFAALDEGRLPVPPGTTPAPSTTPATSSPPATGSEPSSPPPTTKATPSPGTSTPPAPSDTTDTRDGDGTASETAPAGAVPSPGANLPTPGFENPNVAGPSVTVPLTPRSEPRQKLKNNPVRTLLNLVEGVNKVVQQAAAPVAKGVVWGLWSIPLLLLFLALQNSIDSRDPKLAEAPVFADPSLPFDDSYDSRPSMRGGPQ